MSKLVVAIKEIGGVEQKRLLGVFDSTWRIFVETAPGDAIEITPSEHESDAKAYKEFEITNAMFHIDDKPECECACHWTYGDELFHRGGKCKCESKPEKIELPPDLPSYEPGLHDWMQQITKAVNSLKGE